MSGISPGSICGIRLGIISGRSPETTCGISLRVGTKPGPKPGPKSGIRSSSMSGIHPAGISPGGKPCTGPGALSLSTPGMTSITRGIIVGLLTIRWSMPPQRPATTPASTT
jgi:hypothetical protein